MTNVSVFRRQAIRAAVRIHEHLQGPAHHGSVVTLPHSAWEDLCQTAQRLRHADNQGWRAASQSLIHDVDYATHRFQREMEGLRQSLLARSQPEDIASSRDIANDLLALGGEFAEVSIDLQEHSVSVLTAGIELEDVYLGSFRIVLVWERIGQRPAYSCDAQEPNHPQDREDITHPHILDHQLCEGEGAASIKASLRAGRLYDFFLLVRQVLGTYNAESAHVALANWNGGLSCHGCGSWVSEDDYSCCDRCDDSVCSDCSWMCSSCSCSVCSECSSFCSKCDERYCMPCLATRDGKTLLLCETCLEAQQKDESDETNDNVSVQPAASPSPAASEAPAPTTDSVCVGEAPVPARSGRNGSRRVRRQPARRPLARRRRAARTASVLVSDGEV